MTSFLAYAANSVVPLVVHYILGSTSNEAPKARRHPLAKATRSLTGFVTAEQDEPMLRQPVLGVGWDVGGWIGRKQAVAIAEWKDHSAQWLATPTRFSIADLGECWGVDDLVRYAWPEAPSEILETRELVMAIDAPLGFPVAFSELLARRSTPSFDPSGPEIENPLAYRETDQHIYRTFRAFRRPQCVPIGEGEDTMGPRLTGFLLVRLKEEREVPR